MAKKPISRIRELSARVEAHLSQFEAMDDETYSFSTPMDEFNNAYRAKKDAAKQSLREAKRNWKNAKNAIGDDMDAAREKLAKESHIGKGALAGTLAGAGVGGILAGAGIARRGKGWTRGMKAVKVGINGLTGATIGAGVGAEIGGRIRKKQKEGKTQFSRFEAIDDETDYSLPSQERRKKNPYARAGMAAGALAGAGAIAANKDKIRAGMQSAAGTMREAGRTAAFRGMRTTAGAMNKGARVAEKISGKAYLPQVQKGADLLKKGGKLLRKKSMKFFSRGAVDTMLRIEEKIHRLETR